MTADSHFVLKRLPLILICISKFIPTSQAAMPQMEYLAALQAAEEKVLRQNEAHLSLRNAVASPSLLERIFGRYYQKGDSWEVAAWQFDNPKMRKTDDPSSMISKPRRRGIFRYEVSDLEMGSQLKANLRITQLEAYGMKPVDPRFDSLTLTTNSQTTQSEKIYSSIRWGRWGERLKVSPDSIHSGMTPLELFPLDVPEISTAARKTVSQLPELPEEILEFTRKIEFKPDFSESTWFEQDDFFGRPIQILWQRGDPWPKYLKTNHGIAILIRKRTR